MTRSRKKLPELNLRGVDSLSAESGTSILIEDLHISSSQPRRYFDPEAMQMLIASVTTHGILQPLLVRPSSQQGQYEIIAGERRYRAAQAVGLTEVPVIIREMSDLEAATFSLIENLQREDLNPIEEVEGILALLALQLQQSIPEVKQLLYRLNNQVSKKGNHNVMITPEMEQVQLLFDQLGRMSWETFTRNRLPLLNLPEELLQALRQGKIAYTKAMAIAKVGNEAQRQQLLEESIAESLSLQAIRDRVKALQPEPNQSESAALQKRFKAAYKKATQQKQLWQNPKQRKKLTSLLTQLEKLIEAD